MIKIMDIPKKELEMPDILLELDKTALYCIYQKHVKKNFSNICWVFSQILVRLKSQKEVRFLKKSVRLVSTYILNHKIALLKI